jgi:hypothetical protein
MIISPFSEKVDQLCNTNRGGRGLALVIKLRHIGAGSASVKQDR